MSMPTEYPDSPLRGGSGRDRVRGGRGADDLRGGVAIGTLRNPAFDLKLHMNNALVLNNDKGNLKASADLAMTGPFNQPYVTGKPASERPTRAAPASR